MSTTPNLEPDVDAARDMSRQNAGPNAGAPRNGRAPSLADLVEQGFARAKDTHERMSEALEDASEAFNQAFMVANKGSNALRMKMIEMLQANMRAGLDAARQLAAARSPSEFLEISADQTRRQLETATAQAQQLSEITEKVVKGTTSSIGTGLSERFKFEK